MPIIFPLYGGFPIYRICRMQNNASDRVAIDRLGGAVMFDSRVEDRGQRHRFRTQHIATAES